MTDRALQQRQSAVRLGRIFGLCATGSLILTVVTVILERAGITRTIVGGLFLITALAVPAVIGIVQRASGSADYLLAGRRIPAIFAGMGAATEWVAAAIILSATGSLVFANDGGHALLVGLTGGYLLLIVTIAPYLRNLGASSLPDFIGLRFGATARVLAVIALVVCCLCFAIPLLQVAALITAHVLALEIHAALGVVAIAITLTVVHGGTRGLTSVQVGQYAILIIASIALFFLIEAPRVDPAGTSYDQLIEALQALARGTGLAPAISPRSIPFRAGEAIGNLELTLCLLAGTVSLPHLLVRPATTVQAGDARMSGAWSLVFIALLVFTLPTFIALWNGSMSVGQSGVVDGLVAAAGLTAMLAAAASVLLTLANSLSYDVARPMSAPAPGSQRPVVAARVMLAAVIALAAYLASVLPPDPVAMVAWAFSLAAAGYFPALVLGIWWPRMTPAAAICGMLIGFGLTLFYIAITRYAPQAGVALLGMSSLTDPVSGREMVDVTQVMAELRWVDDVPASAINPLASKVGWLNVNNMAAGMFGLAAGFLTCVIVSLLGKGPTKGQKTAIEALRTPFQSPSE